MPDSSPIETAFAPFAPFAVDDDVFARAYEALGPRQRARLKACIAVLYETFGEPLLDERRERHFRQGFSLVDDDGGPCSGVIFVCDGAYPSPERFLAALMPAVMAGTAPRVLFRRGAGQEAVEEAGLIAPLLLTALELAGVEDAWLLDDAAILDLFRRTVPDSGTRLVLLAEKPFGDALALAALHSGALCRGLFGCSSGSCCGRTPGGSPAGPADGVPSDILFWPHLEPGWFRLRSRRASTSNRK